MNGLTPRQRLVLGLVVREYVASAAPVGSKALVGAYGLDISPATIRNEMALLEQAGYLYQPIPPRGASRRCRAIVTSFNTSWVRWSSRQWNGGPSATSSIRYGRA